jgi:hypothetical protein
LNHERHERIRTLDFFNREWTRMDAKLRKATCSAWPSGKQPQTGCQHPYRGRSLPSRGWSLPSRGWSLPSRGWSLPCRRRSHPCRGRNLPCRGRNLPCRGRNLPCRGRNLPCRGRNLPCRGWSLPCRGKLKQAKMIDPSFAALYSPRGWPPKNTAEKTQRQRPSSPLFRSPAG